MAHPIDNETTSQFFGSCPYAELHTQVPNGAADWHRMKNHHRSKLGGELVTAVTERAKR